MNASATRITRGDVDAMLGNFVDNLAVFLTAISLNLFVVEMPANIVFGRILPGMAMGILVSNIHLRWLASRLSRQLGRDDIAALPAGVSIVFVLIYTFGIILPVKIITGDPELAWQVGMVATVLGGVLEIVGAAIGPQLQNFLPRAAMLGTLAGIGIAFIAGLSLDDIFGNPYVGFPAMAIIFWAYIGRGKMPFRLPAGLVALILGAIIATGLGQAQLDFSGAGFVLPQPWVFFIGGAAWSQAFTMFLGVIIPIAVINVIVTIDNVDSAHAVGDPYPMREPMFMDGVASLVGGIFGSLYPNTVFIGHPAYKRMGARVNYGFMAAGLLFILALFGLYQGISLLIPLAAVFAILVFVGLTMTDVAFQAVPRKEFVAVAAAMVPFMIELGKEHIDLTTAAIQAPPLAGADLDAVFPGYGVLSYGTVIIAMILGALVSFMLTRDFLKAGLVALVAAVLAFFGVIHTPQMSFGAAVPLAAMWLLLAIGFAVVHQFRDQVVESEEEEPVPLGEAGGPVPQPEPVSGKG